MPAAKAQIAAVQHPTDCAHGDTVRGMRRPELHERLGGRHINGGASARNPGRSLGRRCAADRHFMAPAGLTSTAIAQPAGPTAHIRPRG
jgi:hypothetical protein